MKRNTIEKLTVLWFGLYALATAAAIILMLTNSNH